MVVEGEVLNDFSRFVGILIAEFAAGGAVNLALKMKGDMIIKNLDLKPTIDAMMRDFLYVKEVEQGEMSSKILPLVMDPAGRCYEWITLTHRLFNIDALTNSMNYKPVVTRNQSNGNAGTKACNDASKARMEIVPGKKLQFYYMWPANPLFSQDSKSSHDVGLYTFQENRKREDAKSPKG
ncbi:hypothetical protein Tco_0009883 [Tanacetum coccineum]